MTLTPKQRAILERMRDGDVIVFHSYKQEHCLRNRVGGERVISGPDFARLYCDNLLCGQRMLEGSELFGFAITPAGRAALEAK